MCLFWILSSKLDLNQETRFTIKLFDAEMNCFSCSPTSKQYNKKIVLHLIVMPQLTSGWRYNYSTQTRPAGQANEQSMYSKMSFLVQIKFITED